MMNTSQQYIKELVTMMRQRGRVSLEAAMLTKHGKVYTDFSPKGYPMGKMGQCYGNSRRLAKLCDDEFTYVEGYAVPAGVGIPLAHAWCIDTEGRIADSTWKDGTHYFGVPLNNTLVESVAVKTRQLGVFCNLWLMRGMTEMEILAMLEGGVKEEVNSESAY